MKSGGVLNVAPAASAIFTNRFIPQPAKPKAKAKKKK
jgi:hypothetical protein